MHLPRFELRGTEAFTVELSGALSLDDARPLAGTLPLAPRPDGRAEVSLLLFRMRGLGVDGLPGPRFDYGEALWRLGVSLDGAPSWLGLCCDIDHPLVRRTGALLVRYPVRAARFAFDAEAGSVRVDAPEGTLHVTTASTAEEPAAAPPRPLVVRDDERLYRIPWREDPAPYRRRATAAVSGRLGASTLAPSLTWDAAALVHRGRVHRCGLAARS
jgi:hypothetical protein